MRILIGDRFPDARRARLVDLGHEPDYRPDLTADELADAVAGCELLIVRSTPVTSTVLAAADRLEAVIRAGSGTNTIDTAAAASRGIAVCNVPGANAAAVAELTFALMLALDRSVPDSVADLRAGRWRKGHYGGARGLCGQRLGIVGLGHVGLAVAERAGAFAMRVHAVSKPGRSADTVARATRIGIELVDDLGALARACPILSFHLPSTPRTRGIIGRELLDQVAPGTWVINTARGDLVDDEALIDAMDRKGVRAGIDVFNDEPATADATFHSRLAAHPNVYGTHHIGASTRQAQEAVAAEVVRMVGCIAQGELPHCVNQPLEPRIAAPASATVARNAPTP